MIFMIHPLHGANNVLPHEVEAHKKTGWVISTHDEWFALTKPHLCKKVVVPEEIPAQTRLGRPPKH